MERAQLEQRAQALQQDLDALSRDAAEGGFWLWVHHPEPVVDHGNRWWNTRLSLETSQHTEAGFSGPG